MATPVPTSRGRIHESEFSAGNPRRLKAVVNFAVVEAKRRSALQICTNPMPAHAPFMAAMIGLGILRAIVMGQRRTRFVARPPDAADSARASMSIPGQNDRPAPVTTMTRTAGSAEAARRLPK